jgi:hypothetical protein
MKQAARVLTLCLILAACSPSAPSPVASGSAAEEYFPLIVGARWVYEIDFGELRKGEVEIVGRGQRSVPGFDEGLFINDEVIDGEAVGFADVAPVGYLPIEGYLGQVSGLDYDDKGGVRVLGGEDPKRLLPLEPRQGSTWEERAKIFELPEGGGGVTRWSRRIDWHESLEVPAGTFREVLVVESTYWDDTLSPDQPMLRFEDYYARGVGLLRSVTFDEQSNGRLVVQQNLLRYSFPEPAATSTRSPDPAR